MVSATDDLPDYDLPNSDEGKIDSPLNILTEDVISLTDAVKEFHAAARPHHCTLWRWCKAGRRGIRLEHVQIGRATFTSRQAIHRFIVATQGK